MLTYSDRNTRPALTSGGEMIVLDNGHWVLPAYKQRMTTKEWKELLLDDKNHIFYNGILTKIVAKNLGYGVVEVYKQLEEK